MMAPNKTEIISSLLLHVRHHHIDKNITLHQKKGKEKKPYGHCNYKDLFNSPSFNNSTH